MPFMKKLNIAYFGTPLFSAYFLEKMLFEKKQYMNISFVVTQKDKPQGRKMQITKSRVKKIAKKYGISVYNNIFNNNYQYLLKDIDIALLYAYGEIVPEKALNIPKYGFWNIHPSLLPVCRGPSPITYPLIMGDKKTGVTLIRLDKELDHGDIISQKEIKILPQDKKQDMQIKLSDLGFNMFCDVVNKIATLKDFKLKTIKQDHKNATYTKPLKRSDGFISFNTLQKALKNEKLEIKDLPEIYKGLKSDIKSSPKIIYDFFCGMHPWPGMWTKILVNNTDKRLKIIDVDYDNNELHINKVQLEGKRCVDYKTFQKAYLSS